MPEYRLNDPRQGIIGPIRLETVRDLVSAGVIQDDVLVSKDNGPWLPVQRFGEVLGRPVAASTPKAAYAGDLGKNSFFKVFYRFHLAQVTGMLTLKDPPRHKDIFLENGRPVFVASNLESERLVEFIRRRGTIDYHDVERALSAKENDYNHLGTALVRLGVMDQQELHSVVAEQQLERLVELCRWRTGQYLFFDGARYTGDRLELNLVASDFILKAARSMDSSMLAERLRPFIDQAVRRLPHAELDGGAFKLDPTEQSALELIDGRLTVAEIVKHFDTVEARRAAFTIIHLMWEIDAAAFTRL